MNKLKYIWFLIERRFNIEFGLLYPKIGIDFIYDNCGGFNEIGIELSFIGTVRLAYIFGYSHLSYKEFVVYKTKKNEWEKTLNEINN